MTPVYVAVRCNETLARERSAACRSRKSVGFCKGLQSDYFPTANELIRPGGRCYTVTMIRTTLISLCSLVLCGMTAANEVDFAREILPILSDKCFVCHGPDAEEDLFAIGFVRVGYR